MRPLIKRLAADSQAPQLAASLWFEYVRLLGTPTVLSMAMATLLHGWYCELSSQSIHWGTAALIVVTSLGMSIAFWRGPSTMGWAGAGVVLVTALLVNSQSSDVCEVHQGFLMVLCGLCAGTVMASAACNSTAQIARASLHDSPPPAGDPAAPHQTVDPVEDTSNPSSPLEEHQPDEQRKSVRGKWLAAGLLLGIFIVYMIVVPVVGMVWEMWTPRPAVRREMSDMSLNEYFRLHAVSGVIMTMFLAMGASVGSFLNVVIFRLPRGRALFWPPSACAACGHRIAGRDNVPILAWLNLSGKCRDCGTAISVRYPLVEALVAAVFVLFFYRELLSGGENLPVRTSNVYRGIVWILFYTKWDLLTIYIFHMFLLTCLFSWGMINLDRFRVPKRTLLIMLSSVVLVMGLAPHLNPLLANGPSTGNRLTAVTSSLIGVGIGGLFGWLLTQLFQLDAASLPQKLGEAQFMDTSAEQTDHEPEPSAIADTPLIQSLASHELEYPSSEQPTTIENANALHSNDLYGSRAHAPTGRSDATAALALIGAGLGYQAALWIGLVAALVALGMWLLKRTGSRWNMLQAIPPLPVTLVLFGVAVAHLAFWNLLHIARIG